jgi:hypothetical protein
MVLYYFTKPTHFAHPSVVKRSVREQPDRYDIRTDAYVFDVRARTGLAQWLKVFEGHDESLKAAYGEKN